MQKNVLLIPLVLVLGCAVVVLCFNLRSGGYSSKASGLSREEILRELPDIEITEADCSMMEALLALPETQESLGKQEEKTFSAARVEAAIAPYLPEGAVVFDFSTIGSERFFQLFCKKKAVAQKKRRCWNLIKAGCALV